MLVTRRFARRYAQRLAETERTELMEIPLHVVSRTGSWFVLVIALAAALSSLALPGKVQRVVSSCTTVALFLQMGVWVTTALVALLDQRKRRALEIDRAAVGSLGIIGVVLRAVVWAVVLLLTLENLGVDVTTLVAGLGVGGIAVALAVQNVLGDLLASLSITLDKPFVVGDFLIVDDFLGAVEHIGIKSVRLRSLSGEQIIMANTDLLKSRVRNHGRMRERRVVFTIGVRHDTPRQALQKIPGLIEAALKRETEVRFDRSHLAKVGDFSFVFETVYYVTNPDYNKYMDIQQRIYFAIHEDFERESIAFASPTQRLWINRPERAATPAESLSTSSYRASDRRASR
jgi:small-conductance mechanosensitive channel